MEGGLGAWEIRPGFVPVLLIDGSLMIAVEIKNWLPNQSKVIYKPDNFELVCKMGQIITVEKENIRKFSGGLIIEGDYKIVCQEKGRFKSGGQLVRKYVVEKI